MILLLIFLASLFARSIYTSSARVEKKAIAKRLARERESRSPRAPKIKSAGSHAELIKQSNAVQTIPQNTKAKPRDGFFRYLFLNQ